MRKPALVALALVVSCTAAADVPTEQHLQGTFVDEYQVDMRYLVWLPEGYGEDPSHRHPLIVFLHGSGDDDYDSTFVIGFGLPAVLAQGDQPDGFDFVVVSPQAAPGSSWIQAGQLETVDDLIEEVLGTYLVDPDRVYLTGLSMGGYASWHLAMRHPQRFAAMVSLSGSAFQLPEPLPDPVACRLTQVPVWGIHGQQDLISRYQPVRAQVEAWEEQCDAEVKWTAYPDAGHFETYRRAYRDPALYDWFLSHTLD